MIKNKFDRHKRKGKKDYKYFIGYLYNDHKIKPLRKNDPICKIMIPHVKDNRWAS